MSRELYDVGEAELLEAYAKVARERDLLRAVVRELVPRHPGAPATLLELIPERLAGVVGDPAHYRAELAGALERALEPR